MNLEFQGLWALALLPLPLLVRYLLPASSRDRQAALRTPFLEDFAGAGAIRMPLLEQTGLLWLAWLAWLCLVLALMRPFWHGETVDIPVSGRDLMLAVDLSESMQQKDFRLSGKAADRLRVTKAVAREFIERRTGDRIGLILFGEKAYLQAPLTFDRETVQVFLDEAVIGLAGRKTAIGDAIGLAVKRLRDRDEENRVLILMTDGANTAGEVKPLDAARVAADAGLRIYTIGLGAEEQVVQGLFGARRVNPSADLDEKTLREISDRTGGRYFRARDLDELQEIYHSLDELEPVEEDPLQFRPQRSLFHYPLALACLLGALILLFRVR